ncbi:MAG: DNA adenine methylase [Cyanobacteria bacterium P01_E01_bin.6]
MPYSRPFLKWAGGKSRVLPQYLPYFPEHTTYYEPFIGGGAIFFYLLPGQAVLADINEELVNVYRCIRNDVEAMIEQLAVHQENHCKDYYYDVRSNPGSHAIARAARFLYLNKTCFNGLYRENSKGQFNVPIGRYKKPTICDPSLLRAASCALKPVAIAHEPFEAILGRAKTSSDFVYFDPPYFPISATSNFTGYNRYSFTKDDQIRLRDAFVTLAERGVKVMLSNSDCLFIRELYEGFNIRVIHAARAINSNAKRRGKITELLITSY